MLPSLEPICGLGFALSLAYIGLPRYRYRAEIKEHAQAKLEGLDLTGKSADDVALLKQRNWYRKVSELAQNGEHADEAGKIKPNGTKEVWDYIYRWIFKTKRDRLCISIGCLIFGLMVFFGVGHEIDAWPISLTKGIFDQNNIIYWFWLGVVFFVAPIVCVWLGRIAVDGACEFVDRNVSDMLEMLKQNVQKAPDVITQQE
jgi:hypothetical protein